MLDGPLADPRISPEGDPNALSESCFLVSVSRAGSSAGLKAERRHLPDSSASTLRNWCMFQIATTFLFAPDLRQGLFPWF